MIVERALIIRALTTIKENRHTEMQNAINAAQLLNNSISRNPDELSQVYFIITSGYLLGVARKVPNANQSFDWLQSLSEQNIKYNWFLAFEAHYLEFYQNVILEDGYGHNHGPVGKYIFNPYMRLGIADTAIKEIPAIIEFQKQNLCSVDPKIFERNYLARPKSWNIMYPLVIHHIDNYKRIVKYLIELELTKKSLM